jgi:hypothetical protein
MAKKSRGEMAAGNFIALPWAVMDSPAFQGASHGAQALLLQLVRQHNGRNNGRLHLTSKWLGPRGWRSANGIHRLKRELVERGLIVRTRGGGLNAGADLYALTWLAITDFKALTLKPADYTPGGWSRFDPLRHVTKQKDRSNRWSSSAPTGGAAQASTAPTGGAETGVFGPSAAPTCGNNVVNQSTVLAADGSEVNPEVRKRRAGQRVVGKKGRSGRPNADAVETPPTEVKALEAVA